MSGWRRALTILALWLPVIALGGTWLLWRSRLPEDLPTHWGAAGVADAATAAPTLLGWLLAVATASALAGTAVLLLPLRGRWAQRAMVGAAAAVGCFVFALWLMSAVPALDVADPYTVELGGWTLAMWGAPFFAAVPLLLIRPPGHPPIEPAEKIAVAPLTVGPKETVAWSRTVRSPLFIVSSVLVLLLGLAVVIPTVVTAGAAAGIWGMVSFGVAFLLVALLCAFRVTADWRGLRVTSLLCGVPLKRIAMANITRAEAGILMPREWGGWGWRIMPGRSALILRRGPGLVVTVRGGTQFAVTVANPEEPAGILRAYLVHEGEGRR